MADKTPNRGVVASIERLRLQRYMTRGPGAKRAGKPEKPSVEALRDTVAKVAKKAAKKRSKKKQRRRGKQ